MAGADSAGGPVVVVIPARYGSTRLPGKPLLCETGRPLVVHVCERARASAGIDRVLVLTDDPRIAAAVHAAGFEARMTRSDHATGGDRIGEVLPTLDAGIIVNVQGDEPEIEPDLIARLVARLNRDPDVAVATAATPIRSLADFQNPNFVKVVVDGAGRALYFSRSAIPGHRADETPSLEGPAAPLLHVGVYAFRRAVLERFVQLPRSPLERAESLEQLRLLENGWRIGVEKVAAAPRGVDTAEDYALFVMRYRAARG